MNQLARLNDLCFRIADYVSKGLPDAQIAEELKLTKRDIRILKQRPEFAAAYQQITGHEYNPIEQARKVGRAQVEQAIDTIAELIQFGSSEETRLRAAKTLLEMMGVQEQKTPSVAIQINQHFENIESQEQAAEMLQKTLSRITLKT